MRFGSRTIMSVCVMAVVAIATPGCGGGNKLDTNAVEQNIIDRIDKRKLPIEKVTCPDDVDAKKGESFRCQAILTGGTMATVNVTQTDDNGTVAYKIQLPKGFKLGETQNPTK
jgi:uncharacterized protein DUF4333